MKTFNKIFRSLSLFILLAMPSLYAGQGDSAYIEEANNNSSLEVDFKLKLKVDIFQFQGDNLPKYQKDINEDLIAFVNENYQEYKSTFAGFIEDISKNFYTLLGSNNELEIHYELHSNTKDLFSIIVYAHPSGGGGNGCKTTLKAFNYILGDNPLYVSNCSLNEILKDDIHYLKLLESINIELSKREYPLKAKLDDLVKHMEFAFAKDELIVNFRPYTIGCGADCIVKARLKYENIKELLSEEILKALKL